MIPYWLFKWITTKQPTLKEWLQYRIVNCGILWKLKPNGHKGFGPYIPRFRWVQWMLEMINPTLYRI